MSWKRRGARTDPAPRRRLGYWQKRFKPSQRLRSPDRYWTRLPNPQPNQNFWMSVASGGKALTAQMFRAALTARNGTVAVGES
jgi:hypothetical protein